MDLLKRSLAPITEEAWEEIDEQAVKVLKGSLSARRILDVKGPLGWNYHGSPEGRLSIADEEFVDGTCYGIRQIQPLIEVRVPFSMDMWDLDDISRGSRTTCLDNLDEAARKAAMFEEKAVYHGLSNACIKGLMGSATNDPVKLKLDGDSIIEGITDALGLFHEISVGGPYVLLCQKTLWNKIMISSKGYPLKKRLEALSIELVLSPMIDCSMLVSRRGGDMEFIIGQDMSIGYSGTSDKKVNLFITESFTLTVPGPEAIIPIEID